MRLQPGVYCGMRASWNSFGARFLMKYSVYYRKMAQCDAGSDRMVDKPFANHGESTGNVSTYRGNQNQTVKIIKSLPKHTDKAD